MMSAFQQLLRRLGLDVDRRRPTSSYPVDFDPDTIEIIKLVKRFTMTSDERVYALIQAVRYLMKSGIEGAVVECGVWRGGSMMAAAQTLAQLGRSDIDLYLFDTYEGMTTPSAEDVDYHDTPAHAFFKRKQTSEDTSDWCRASFVEVERNMLATGYPKERIKMIRGRVEDTIPNQAPNQIALLRLDTDWYESTRHELYHLYPRLSRGGVLIIDDYGHWRGSQKATEEYFQETAGRGILLNRIDYTARIGVKP